jgi:transposase
MEATGGYEKLGAKTLAKSDFKVSVVNPRSVKDFAQENLRVKSELSTL